MSTKLPPGPSWPSLLQTMGWWSRPLAFHEGCRARHGNRYTVRLLATPPFVMHADPEHIREIFTAPPDVLHPGEGAAILEPVVGSRSVILLDEGAHLSQRRLMLPAFHGEKMQALADLVTEVTEREVAAWPAGEAAKLHPRLQALTLEVILRAVFGLDQGPRLDALRSVLTAILDHATRPMTMVPFMQRSLGGHSRWDRFVALREQADALVYELVDERRDSDEDRDDILAMLLAARHEDGSPMEDVEVRDELMTLLVAGHETTASSLAFAFKILARHADVVERLRDGDDDYLGATITEVLRARPVLPNAAPRLVKKPVEVGGWEYEPGVCLIANTYLVHHDPAIYPDPYSFRPERFLDEQPGTYTWIPFGGGRRRCLGASFAILEMKTVLRAVLGRYDLQPAGDEAELSRRRSITISPRDGAMTVLRERVPQLTAV
ncbi:MAG: cytochrome P450 [Thermoleophilaceae bacterium]